jgi:hypothetical protein
MRAIECSSFFVRETAIKPLNASKAPAAIRKYANAIRLSQSKEPRCRTESAASDS